MKKTLRTLSILLSVSMLLASAGCKKSEETSKKSKKTKKDSEVTETEDPEELSESTTEETTTEESTEESTEETTELQTNADGLYRTTLEAPGENVSVSFELDVDQDGLNSCRVETLGEGALINSSIPGYIGSAFTATGNGRIGLCKITFEISSSVLSKAGPDFQPAIYALNEDTMTWYEFVTTVEDGKASALSTYLGTFILLDKTAYDAAKAKTSAVDLSQDPGTDSNNDGLSDFVTQLICDGTIRTSTGTLVFGDASFEDVQANDDFDNDGIKNGEEFTLITSVKVPSDAVEFEGRFYRIYDMGFRWDDVESLCESGGGHLLTVTSEEEWEFVKGLLQNGTKKCYWLGANDVATEGTFLWVTGEPFEFTDWAAGEPNNDGAEDYLEIETWNEYRWNDGEVDGDFGQFSQDNHGFICEWEASETGVSVYVQVNG